MKFLAALTIALLLLIAHPDPAAAMWTAASNAELVATSAVIIDAELIGESVRATALPWDTIDTTKFRAGQPLDTTISSLTANHVSRSKEDPDFQYLVDGIRDIEEIRSRKTVSLNIESREAEREDSMNRRLERENARREALNLEPLANIEALEELEAPDIQLDQAAAIVTDLAELRVIESTPTHTAQTGS